MNWQARLGKISLWLGIVFLAVTTSLHLTLGVPPLTSAIENGFITKAPGMRPSELLGIWIVFSVIFYVMLAGFILERWVRKQPSKVFAASIGIAAMSSAVVMDIVIPGSHIAFPLLMTPGILILGGTFLEYLGSK